jgi:hypothetical protein
MAPIRLVERAQSLYDHRGERYADWRLAQAIRAARRTLGATSPRGLITLELEVGDLAYRALTSRAIRLNSYVVEGYRHSLGELDRRTIRALHWHSQLLWRAGNTAAALQVANRVLDLTLMPEIDQLDNLAAKAGLAVILADNGRLSEAREFQQDVLSGRAEILGNDPRTLQAMIDLFMTEVEVGDRVSASRRLPQIRDLMRETFGARYSTANDDLLDISPALEANYTDLRLEDALNDMIETGSVPSRQRIDLRPMFDM